MTRKLWRISPFLLAASCSVALWGCGGRSAGPETGTPTVYRPGLTASSVTPTHATDADEHALAALLPDPAIRFAPVSSALGAMYGGTAVGLTADARVESVSSDGDNGFTVSYVLDGEERQVHFTASDFGTSHHPGGYYKETDEAVVRLSSATGSFGAAERNRGHPDLRYYDLHRIDVVDHGLGEHSIFAAFGARTTEDRLPVGRALYLGTMATQVVATDGQSEAVELFGSVSLTVDFAQSTLDGAITELSVREHDSAFPTPLSLGSRFRIEEGEFAKGRFTASLMGVDSDADAPLQETVRGYEGAMLGELYGPGAEELGGVLNARSEAHGRVLAGWFGSALITKDPDIPTGDPSVQSTAIERDHVAMSARRTDARVTAVERDGAAGTFVTYDIDGVEQRVHFTASDLDPNSTGYAGRVGSRTFRFGPASGQLRNDASFDYFDLSAWAATDHAGDGAVLSERLGYGVFGVPTPTEALPGGEARYIGRVTVESEPEGPPGFGSSRTYEGRLELAANLGAGVIEGMIDGVRDTTTGAPDPDGFPRRVFVWNGVIVDGRFTAELNDGLQDATGFIGEMNGQLYGPAAAEVGGVLEGRDHLNDRVVHGWFGGDRTAN